MFKVLKFGFSCLVRTETDSFFKSKICLIESEQISLNVWGMLFLRKTSSQGSDVSNFIESDQKVAPYHLVVFYVMTPKSGFLLIGD